MVTSTSSSDSAAALAKLDPVFRTTVSSIMTQARQPVTRFQTQRDAITVRRAIYTDVKNNLDALQTAISGLMSSSGVSPLSPTTRSTSVSPTTGGTSVLSATAASTAVTGVYNVTVNSLAKEQRVASDAQPAGADTALSLSGSFTLNGAAITVSSSNTLNDIAGLINNATGYNTDQSVSASVIGGTLVLSGAAGTNTSISAADVDTGSVLSTLGFGTKAGDGSVTGSISFDSDSDHALQSASNASLTVNGVSLTRSKNSGLTDIISGLTLNLQSDAVYKDPTSGLSTGRSATLTIGTASSPAASLLDSFVKNFNTTMTHLTNKTGVASTTDAVTGKKTYTRGELAGDTTFTTLRGELMGMINRPFTNSGSLSSLNQLGLSVSNTGQLSLNKDTLNSLMTSNPSGVVALMDAAMTGMNGMVGQHTGTSGVLSSRISSSDTEITQINTRMTQLNEQLTQRQDSLITQYSAMQAQITEMTYQSQLMNSLYSSYSTISTSG